MELVQYGGSERNDIVRFDDVLMIVSARQAAHHHDPGQAAKRQGPAKDVYMTATGTKPKNPCRRGEVHTCGLAGPGATAARDGRQDAARLDHQAWQQLHPAQPGAGREVSDLGGDGQGCRAQSMLPAPALDPGAARKPSHQHTRRCRRKPYRARRLRHHAERPALRSAPPRAAGMSPFIETSARREGRQAQAHQGKRPAFSPEPPPPTGPDERARVAPGKRLQQGSFIRRIGQRRGTQR